MRIYKARLSALALLLFLIGGVIVRRSIVIGGPLIVLGVLTTFSSLMSEWKTLPVHR